VFSSQDLNYHLQQANIQIYVERTLSPSTTLVQVNLKKNSNLTPSFLVHTYSKVLRHPGIATHFAPIQTIYSMHAHAGEERFITIDNAISYSRPSSIHTTTNSSTNMISLVDSEDDESDLPALADASDSETSSLCSSDYDARHNSHGNGATISSNFNHGPMKDDDSPKTTHASPPPSSPTSNLASTCASLFCIPELFSCEEEPPSSPLDCIKTHPQSQNTTTTTATTATTATSPTTTTNIRRTNSIHPTKITYLQNIQTNIQHDILNLLGNQSSIFCCLGIRDQDTPEQHGHHHGHIHNPQSQQSRYDHNVQRRGNRNVYMRKNAMKRIESLRGSGLCKNFSFARFSLSAQEEEDINTSKTAGDDPTDRTRIGISHSIDWSGLQHGRTSQGWMGRGPDSISNHDYHGHDSNTVLGCSTKQTMMAVPSFDSVASEVELYYDSDPGPEGNDSMPQPRKKTNKARDIASEVTKRRKQRGGDGMGTHTHTRTGAGAALSPSAMGMLQTYDVPSFDINDAHKVSQLIAVRIEISSFCIHPTVLLYCTAIMLWHPKASTDQNYNLYTDTF